MKTINFYSTIVLFFLSCSAFAQVQIDKQIQLTGSGTDAEITGIKTVANDQDATSAESIQKGRLIYSMSGGSSNNFVVNLTPAVSAYDTGMVINFISNQTVTGPSTLEVNGLGGKPITKNYDMALSGCEIHNGQVVTVVYDGANFQMTSVFNTAPSTPGLISGTDSLCPNTTGITYSISPVSGATGYNWTVPAGDTITGNTGTSITVNFGANPAGNIAVAATNTCGTSVASALTVVNASCITATGATITNSGGYTYYTFSDTGSFTFSIGYGGNFDVLVVAGGGSGGGDGGGGGGGGGVIYQGNYTISAGNYNVTVGAGGVGSANFLPMNGENSSFGTLVAVGGGGGGSRDAHPSGNSGGSGGGGGGAISTGGPGGPGTTNQGNSGGNSSNYGSGDLGCASSGGGGGGANTAGAVGTSETGGNGGNGLSYFGNTYGGGGGGGVTCAPGTGGTSGSGGGGNGSATAANGSAGTNGLGGGGGGGGPGYTWGNGGSGVVIVRYH